MKVIGNYILYACTPSITVFTMTAELVHGGKGRLPLLVVRMF